ncbi:hypothetical protein F6Y05_32585 [Bacillus megaterium]|nr:hypothetical protein [Priestia megaterium]
MTPWLLLLAVIIIPLLVYQGITVKSFLSGHFPIVEKVPTMIVFMAFCYPLYALYEAYNAVIIFNKGNLQLKNLINLLSLFYEQVFSNINTRDIYFTISG